MKIVPRDPDVEIAERLGHEARKSGISRSQNPYARAPFSDSSLFEDIHAALLRNWWRGWDSADAAIAREKLR